MEKTTSSLHMTRRSNNSLNSSAPSGSLLALIKVCMECRLVTLMAILSTLDLISFSDYMCNALPAFLQGPSIKKVFMTSFLKLMSLSSLPIVYSLKLCTVRWLPIALVWYDWP